MSSYRGEPHVGEAPLDLTNRRGQFYVAKGRGELGQYLHADGAWRDYAYWFPDKVAAERALAERT
jgi:hypothetical protein